MFTHYSIYVTRNRYDKILDSNENHYFVGKLIQNLLLHFEYESSKTCYKKHMHVCIFITKTYNYVSQFIQLHSEIKMIYTP